MPNSRLTDARWLVSLLLVVGCGSSRISSSPSGDGGAPPRSTNVGQSLSQLQPVASCPDLLAHLKARVVQQMNEQLERNLDTMLRNQGLCGWGGSSSGGSSSGGSTSGGSTSGGSASGGAEA